MFPWKNTWKKKPNVSEDRTVAFYLRVARGFFPFPSNVSCHDSIHVCFFCSPWLALVVFSRPVRAVSKCEPNKMDPMQ